MCSEKIVKLLVSGLGLWDVITSSRSMERASVVLLRLLSNH